MPTQILTICLENHVHFARKFNVTMHLCHKDYLCIKPSGNEKALQYAAVGHFPSPNTDVCHYLGELVVLIIPISINTARTSSLQARHRHPGLLAAVNNTSSQGEVRNAIWSFGYLKENEITSDSTPPHWSRINYQTDQCITRRNIKSKSVTHLWVGFSF